MKTPHTEKSKLIDLFPLAARPLVNQAALESFLVELSPDERTALVEQLTNLQEPANLQAGSLTLAMETPNPLQQLLEDAVGDAPRRMQFWDTVKRSS